MNPVNNPYPGMEMNQMNQMQMMNNGIKNQAGMQMAQGGQFQQQPTNNDIENANENNKNNPVDKEAERIQKTIRIGFIRKVYGILTVQMLITVAIASIGLNEDTKEFLKENPIYFYIAIGLSLVVIIPLVCCKKVAKKVPLNYILLFVWTMLEGFIVANAIAYYDPKTVMMAAAGTAGISISLTIYACYTKTDFTYCGGMLFCMLAIFTIFGIIMLITGFFINAIYCILGLALFSLYLIYDTQLIMGKHGREYSIDDYVIAALNIYLDIVNIFLYLLSLFGGK